MHSSQVLAFVEPKTNRSHENSSAGRTSSSRRVAWRVWSHNSLRGCVERPALLLLRSACIKFLILPVLSVLIFMVLMIAELGNRRRTDLYRPHEFTRGACSDACCY
jgi:hypothetical protein